MSLEDELRATMRAHDGEAPTVADLPERPWAGDTASRRRGLPAWLPVAAAAAVVLAVAGLAFGIGHRDGRSADHDGRPVADGTQAVSGGRQSATSGRPLNCPSKYNDKQPAPWVPAKPRGVAAGNRLVPDETPTSVVICGYVRSAPVRPGSNAGGHLVVSHRTLTGDLSAVTRTLTWLPRQGAGRPCEAYLAVTDADRFLIALRYPHGSVWVSASRDHCAVSGNGEFTAAGSASDFARAALGQGHWVTDPPPTRTPMSSHTPTGPCYLSAADQFGRLGQETRMVPAAPIRVTICSGADRPQLGVTSTHVGALVDALDALPTQQDTSGCQPVSGGTPTETFSLFFHYRVGPAVTVSVARGCRPSTSNGNLQSTDNGEPVAVIAQIDKLLRTR